ncbi:SKI family transcriptional corepressor 1 [Elysia marginata]|uniref:SKI family transcriptional corepressor 1 n=1 Tax=Elysia marginata TaxID=1093978 RepID=A0AAV4GLW6_9GAST|nr:SKI family transcriptional corepressor 1 [Elysia marginata]
MAPGYTIKTSEAFIQCFEERPVLYNVRDPGYYKKDTRKRALEEMCSQLDLPLSDEVVKAVSEKIRQLRSTFARHLRDFTASKKSGASADDISHPTWRWFRNLYFLTPHLKLRKGTSNLHLPVS